MAFSNNAPANKISPADYKDSYKDEIQQAISFIGQDLDFFTEVKVNHILCLSQAYIGDPASLRVLDVGCGIGITDTLLSPLFEKMYGVDIDEGIIEMASKRNPAVTYKKYDGQTLPFPANTFDLVFAIGVMHHVPPDEWSNLLHEMKRVAKKGGLLVVFEHNPYNPLTRHVVRRVAFDKDAVLLSRKKIRNLFIKNSLKVIAESYIIFFPFRAKIFPLIEKKLHWCPLGAQHFVAGKKI